MIFKKWENVNTRSAPADRQSSVIGLGNENVLLLCASLTEKQHHTGTQYDPVTYLTSSCYIRK